MKLVNSALAEKQVRLEDLPASLTDRIANLRDLILKYNEACDEYDEEADKDAETEAKLDAMEDVIATTEQELAEEIKDYDKDASQQQQQQQQQQSGGVKKEEKKDSSLGWLIFGGIALVATFGAVNLLKKK
jgi:predicted RNase H-like nuclease (RuvC/YqgF family)